MREPAAIVRWVHRWDYSPADGRLIEPTEGFPPANVRLCLEYDGGTHRTSLIEDNRRQNRLMNAGFRLLRFTAADVQRNPESIVVLVRAALSIGSGSWRRSRAGR